MNCEFIGHDTRFDCIMVVRKFQYDVLRVGKCDERKFRMRPRAIPAIETVAAILELFQNDSWKLSEIRTHCFVWPNRH